jgi:hypothetical protein
MATPTAFPSWAYNPTQPAVVVKSLDVFNILPPPGRWSATPYDGNPPQRPEIDPPGTPLAAMLAILLLLTQRLPEPPAAVRATAADERTQAEKEHAEKEAAEKEHGHRRHAEIEEPAEPEPTPKPRNHRGKE